MCMTVHVTFITDKMIFDQTCLLTVVLYCLSLKLFANWVFLNIRTYDTLIHLQQDLFFIYFISYIYFTQFTKCPYSPIFKPYHTCTIKIYIFYRKTLKIFLIAMHAVSQFMSFLKPQDKLSKSYLTQKI